MNLLSLDIKKFISICLVNDAYLLARIITSLGAFNSRFKNDKSIKIEFNNGYVEQKRLQAKEKILNLLSKEDRIFLDKNIPEEEKISIFIKMKRGVDIPPAKIKEYLKL